MRNLVLHIAYITVSQDLSVSMHKMTCTAANARTEGLEAQTLAARLGISVQRSLDTTHMLDIVPMLSMTAHAQSRD